MLHWSQAQHARSASFPYSTEYSTVQHSILVSSPGRSFFDTGLQSSARRLQCSQGRCQQEHRHKYNFQHSVTRCDVYISSSYHRSTRRARSSPSEPHPVAKPNTVQYSFVKENVGAVRVCCRGQDTIPRQEYPTSYRIKITFWKVSVVQSLLEL